MSKFQGFLTKLQSFAGAVNENNYMKAVSSGLSSLLPIIILGAFANLLNNIGIVSYQAFLESSGLKRILGIPYEMTIGLIAIFAVFFIAYRLAVLFEEDGAGAGLIALVTFLVLTPIAQLNEANVLPFQYLGAQGLFTAIIIALLSTRLYVFILKKGWTIKMPAGVPPSVTKSFSNLIPGMLIPVLFLIVGGLFMLTPFDNIHATIYSLIQAPLQNLGSGFGSLIIAVLLINFFWLLGIHGGLVMMPILLTVWMPLGLENLDQIAAGNEPTNIVSLGLYSEFISLGGAGATIGLVLLMVLIGKSKRFKTLGKIALPASFFSINEPVIFGTPLMLNPYMAIPFVTAPVVIGVSTFLLMSTGILPIANGTPMPVGSPLFIGGFIQGGFILALWQLICIGVSMAIYYPFFRIIDKKAVQEEQQAEEQQAEEQQAEEQQVVGDVSPNAQQGI